MTKLIPSLLMITVLLSIPMMSEARSWRPKKPTIDWTRLSVRAKSAKETVMAGDKKERAKAKVAGGKRWIAEHGIHRADAVNNKYATTDTLKSLVAAILGSNITTTISTKIVAGLPHVLPAIKHIPLPGGITGVVSPAVNLLHGRHTQKTGADRTNKLLGVKKMASGGQSLVKVVGRWLAPHLDEMDEVAAVAKAGHLGGLSNVLSKPTLLLGTNTSIGANATVGLTHIANSIGLFGGGLQLFLAYGEWDRARDALAVMPDDLAHKAKRDKLNMQKRLAWLDAAGGGAWIAGSLLGAALGPVPVIVGGGATALHLGITQRHRIGKAATSLNRARKHLATKAHATYQGIHL